MHFHLNSGKGCAKGESWTAGLFQVSGPFHGIAQHVLHAVQSSCLHWMSSGYEARGSRCPTHSTHEQSSESKLKARSSSFACNMRLHRYVKICSA